jgi:hypothetical protein
MEKPAALSLVPNWCTATITSSHKTAYGFIYEPVKEVVLASPRRW